MLYELAFVKQHQISFLKLFFISVAIIPSLMSMLLDALMESYNKSVLFKLYQLLTQKSPTYLSMAYTTQGHHLMTLISLHLTLH